MKNIKHTFFWSSLPLLLLFLFWQSQPKTEKEQPLSQEQLIQIEVQKRIERFRIQKMKNCRRAAYQQATHVVDSILIARAKAERVTEIQRPPKPNKPNRPKPLSPQDTTPVQPLIEKLNTAQ